ncbi:MAG TPA: alpha/beta hydrolase [Ktedonobacterales bacterium]
MQTRYLERAGGRLAYDEVGDGPLVVCAPSLGDLRGEYRFLAPQLAAEGYRVVSFDLRGMGDSSARWDDYSAGATGADMLALVRALGGKPAYLIGTSISGSAAIWAAAEAPELVAGIIMIGAGVDGNPASRRSAQLTYGPLLARPWGAAIWLWYYSTLYPAARPDDWTEYTARLRGNLRERGRLAAMRQQIYALSDGASQMAPRLARVTAPALVIMGSKDRDFKDPAYEAQHAAERLHGTARLIEGAGHYPHAEVPAQTGPIIVEFLQRAREGVAHGA